MLASGSITAKLSDLLVVDTPKYTYLRLIPSNSIKNNASTKIISTIATTYTTIEHRIQSIENKYHYEKQSKVGFFIHMTKDLIEFYMIVPEKYYTMYKEKITDIWSNKLTIEIVDSLPMYEYSCSKCSLGYKFNDAFSLECDCRSNLLLNTVLNSTHVMESGDQVGVFYNFYPTYDKPWKTKYDKAIEKYKEEGQRMKERISLGYAFTLLLNLIIKACDIVLSSINLGTSKNTKVAVREELSIETTKKRDRVTVNAQILCFSQSEDKQRERNNLYALTSSYECLDGDNKLIPYKYKKTTINLLETKIRGCETIRISDREGQNFICLPGRECIASYPQIEHTNVLETQIPKQLQTGTICIGDSTYKGTTQKTYLPNTANERNLALIIIGPSRSGKTTLISNLCHDANLSNECNINFDFCGDCETSRVLSSMNDINVLNVDCSNPKILQGLGYNEIKIGKNAFEVYTNAKIQTGQLLHLINSVNADDKELKSKMMKHLSAVSNIVFVCGGSINDVFKCLQDHKLRQNYIKLIPFEQKSNLEDYITNMKELDETKDGKPVGTKYNLVTGILDRIEKLKQNVYMEMMIKKPCKDNFNLLEEIQKPQTINFRMPETMFPTQEEKDVYVTYWLTKLWISLKYRMQYIPKEKHTKVNIFIDELYQVHHAEEYVKGILSQMAKFDAKMIISCHYINQLTTIREELKSANCSYMLISGCNKQNYTELKDELEPYQVEDLLSLKKFHSLNLIKLPDGYTKFVTKLPPKLH